MELVKGNEPKVNEEVDQMMFAWPKLIIRELIVLAGVLAFLSLISVYFDAPLEPPADPANPTNPAKAPWYFLGLQELTSYDGFIGGIVIPGILAGGVMVLPYIEMFFETFTKTYGRTSQGFGLLKKELWKMHIYWHVCFHGRSYCYRGLFQRSQLGNSLSMDSCYGRGTLNV